MLQVGWVQRCHHGDPVESIKLSPPLHHPTPAAEQPGERNVPKDDYDFGTDDGNFLLQPWQACGPFLCGQRPLSILSRFRLWAKFAEQSQIDLGTIQPHGLEDASQQLPRRPYERFRSGLIFCTRSAAHEDDVGHRSPRRKNQPLPQSSQRPGRSAFLRHHPHLLQTRFPCREGEISMHRFRCHLDPFRQNQSLRMLCFHLRHGRPGFRGSHWY